MDDKSRGKTLVSIVCIIPNTPFLIQSSNMSGAEEIKYKSGKIIKK